MNQKWERVFEKYNRYYETILDVFYPAKNNTGFPERNLSVNFAKAYVAEHPGSVVWYEFQFGEKNNLHLDALIVNQAENEILLIEAKRFKNATGQVASAQKDVNRIFQVAKDEYKDVASRIDGFWDYTIYGVLLTDVWTESDPKIRLMEAFENSTFVSEYLEAELAEKLQAQCNVQHYIQKPKQLKVYYLTSLVWKAR